MDGCVAPGSAPTSARCPPRRQAGSGRNGRPAPPARPTRACRPAGAARGAAGGAGSGPWRRQRRSVPPSLPAPGRPTAEAAGLPGWCRGRRPPPPRRARRGRAKASTRCVQWRAASGAAGGSADPLHSGKPRQSRPASKLATWAPNRITTKPSAAVASTSRCLGCRAEDTSGARAAGSAPARSPTTSRVASSTIALAKWVMTTQGGRTSFTVTAPRST